MVCKNPPKYRQNTINRYFIQEECLVARKRGTGKLRSAHSCSGSVSDIPVMRNMQVF